MRSLKTSKSLITFDNVQCQCFQAQLPTKQFFLSKNQMPKTLIPEKPSIQIPEKNQPALTKTSVKRSLKRLGSTPRNETVFQSQDLEIDQKPNFKAKKLAENGSVKLLKSYKTSPNPFQAARFEPPTTTISFKKLYCDYNPSLIQYNSTQQQQSYLNINPENIRPAANQNNPQVKKIETYKINFNFTPSVPPQKQPLLMSAQLIKTQSLKFFNQPAQIKMSQELKIPKLERKHSKFGSTDLGITQTLTKHSVKNQCKNQAQVTQIDDKTQIRETGTGLKDLNQVNINIQSTKTIQATKSKQNTYKSVINTKRSLLSQTTKSKIVTKKDRPKPVLNKMQDVEEIRSLADSDEEQDSDKESVVLGRLNEYQSATIHRNNSAPLELQQSLRFIQNQNSIIMDTPSGEWRYEAQSDYNY